MGLFGLTNPFDELIEKATSENSLGEDWATILHVCDKINSTENGVRDSLKSIKTRLLSSNQRISNAAVVLHGGFQKRKKLQKKSHILIAC